MNEEEKEKEEEKRIEKELEKNKLLLEECFALLQPSPVGQKKVVFHVYHRVGVQIIRMVWAEDLKNLTENRQSPSHSGGGPVCKS